MHRALYRRALLSLPHRSLYATSSKPPPQPLPYKSATPEERLARRQAAEAAAQAPPPARQSAFGWLWPFASKQRQLQQQQQQQQQHAAEQAAAPPPAAPDPERGYEAARVAATTGKLDPRYTAAKWRVLSIIVALPFVLVLSYELAQRRFYGKEKKSRSARGEGLVEELATGVVPSAVLVETEPRRW